VKEKPLLNNPSSIDIDAVGFFTYRRNFSFELVQMVTETISYSSEKETPSSAQGFLNAMHFTKNSYQ
jgi:hypothetical protein